MERIVLVVILLGVFVGCISSMTSLTTMVHPERPESGQAMIAAKDRSLEVTRGETYEEVRAPRSDAAKNIWLETIRAPETSTRGGREGPPVAANSSVSHLDGGILVNDGRGGALLYVNFSVVVMTIPHRGSLDDAERAVQDLGGILIDAWEERIAVLLPPEALARMEDLVADGKIQSLEAGGFGSGFGKA